MKRRIALVAFLAVLLCAGPVAAQTYIYGDLARGDLESGVPSYLLEGVTNLPPCEDPIAGYDNVGPGGAALLTTQSGNNAPGWYRCTSTGWVLVASASGSYTTGTTFPTTPMGDDLFEFNDSATALTMAVDYDGTTPVATASRGDLFKYDSANMQWVKQSASGTGGGATNLTVGGRDADSLDIQSDTGTNATVPSATGTLAGLQSAADKTKLDGVEASATADQTAGEIRDSLQTLTGNDRLNATAIQGIPAGGTDDQTASEVNTDTTNFNGTLSGTDTTVQAALDTIDNLTVTGTDDQTAAEVNADTADFDTALSAADATVQMALDTLDEAAEATVVDVTGTGPPQASADTVNNLFVDTEIPRVWFTTSHAESDGVPTGTWAAYTNANYRGVNRGTPGSPVIGQFFYRDATSFHAWYRAEQGAGSILWRQRPAQTVLGNDVTWLGDASTDADALLRIDTFDNTRTYIYYNASNREVRQLDNTSYTAGTLTVAYQYGSVELRSEIAAWAEADNVDQIPRAKISLPEYLTGTTFPASPVDNDLFEFNADAATITNAVDYDGTSALTSASRGDVFKYDGTNTRWQRQSASGTGGGGATNLAIANRDTDSIDVTSDTGTDATIPSATTTLAGLQSSADKTKLDGIEANATADQTGAEIKTAYEGEADTNAFTDADHTKLDGIATNATANVGDVTGIDAGDGITVTDGDTATPQVAVTNPFTDADETKLDGIADNATANAGDVTGIDAGTGITVADGDTATPEVSVTNPFEAADETKLDGIEASADVTDRANVYDQTSDIIVAGTNVTLTTDDTAQTVTINSTGGGMNTPTNLGIANRDADSLDVTSSSGTDATIESATDTEAGLLSAADKVNLDGVQTFARREPVDMWDVSDWARQAVYGNQRIGRHLTVAPVGEDEAVLYRSGAKLIPVYNIGQVFDSDPNQTADLRDPSTGTTTVFGHLSGEAEQPDDFPAYMLPDGVATADWLRLRLVFTGTDVPYITGNIRFFDSGGTSVDTEFLNWEELVMYLRLQRADGMGRVFEGLFPLNADQAVGADVRGDPYSAREINFRTYLGINTDGLALNRPGDVNASYSSRRNQYPGGPDRTMMEAMIEWFFDEDGYHLARLYPSSPDYEGAFLIGSEPQPTQAQIDPFVVDATIVFVNGVDPRFNHIELSALHGDITAFRSDDHEKLDGLTEYETGSAFPASPSNDDIFEFNTSATALTDTYDYNGTTAITTAARGDVFKYASANTRWIKQSASGTGGGGDDQIELVDSMNDVSYEAADTADLSTRFGGATVYTADIDAEGDADAEINDMFVFQWRDDPSSIPDDRQLGIRINDTGTTLPIRIIDPLTNALTNKRAGDVTRYEFLFLSRQDGVFIQLSTMKHADIIPRLLPGSPSDDQIARYDSATSAWVAENLFRYSTGTAFPASPTADDLFEFNDSADSLTNTVDYDGSTAITSAARGDVFKRVGTNWVKQSASGAGGAPLDSPVFTGNPRGPTPTAGDNDTSLATTAFVQTRTNAALASVTWQPASLNLQVTNLAGGSTSQSLSRLREFKGDDPTGSTDFLLGDYVRISGNFYMLNVASKTVATPADIASDTDFRRFAFTDSPALTGNPTAPTAAANDNDTSIATTAYVQTELAAERDSPYYAIPDGSIAGTGSAIEVTTGHSLSAYVNGLQIFFYATGNNVVGGTTINVDSIGARAIRKSNGIGDSIALAGGEITDNDPVLLTYSAEANQFFLGVGRAGSAAFRNVGNAQHQIPALEGGGRFNEARIPTTVARLAGPTFTGDPTAPTPAADDNDTSIATTAYVQTEIAGVGGGTSYQTGGAFPGSPGTNDIFEFNDGATGLSDAVDYDGSTPIATASRGDVFKYDGTNWVKQSASGTGGGGATNLSIANRDADSLEIASDTGTDAEIPSASTTEAGLMSAADKTSLNGAIDTVAFQASTNQLITEDVGGTMSGVFLSILREFKGNDPTGTHTFGYGDYVRISGNFYMSNAQSVTVTDPSTIPTNANFRAFAFLDSPVFTGDPQAPTPADDDADTSIATTAYVNGLITALTARVAALEGMPVQDHTNRAAISPDTTLDATEFNAGTTSTTNTITIPTWMSGTQYVFLCVPDDEADITAISQGGINVFAGFQAAPDVESHSCWRTIAAQNTAGSGVTYVITQ